MLMSALVISAAGGLSVAGRQQVRHLLVLGRQVGLDWDAAVAQGGGGAGRKIFLGNKIINLLSFVCLFQ